MADWSWWSDGLWCWWKWLWHVNVDVPGLVEAVVAVPEDNVSSVSVNSSVDIEALLSVVSDVSSSSSVESGFLVNLTSPWSDSSGDSNSEGVSLLVSNDVTSVGPGSDGSSSLVEDEPLSVVLWCVVSDSESVLVATDVLLPVQSSEGAHSRFDLESSAVWKWLSWVGVGSLVDIPGLVQTVVAVPHDGVSEMSVDSSMDIEAVLVVELDVLSASVVPNDLLNGLTSVGSDDDGNSSPQSLSLLSRKNVASSGPGSDGSGSGIESPPLSR